LHSPSPLVRLHVPSDERWMSVYALLCHCHHLEAQDDQVSSVLMRNHLIREHPALEPTDEFVRKDVGKAIEKDSS